MLEVDMEKDLKWRKKSFLHKKGIKLKKKWEAGEEFESSSTGLNNVFIMIFSSVGGGSKIVMKTFSQLNCKSEQTPRGLLRFHS